MKQSGQSGNRRVLITGATGFIGANLIEKLLADTKCHIYAFYNNPASSYIFTLKPFRNSRIKPCQIDLLDFKSIKSAIHRIKPHYVVHLGAVVNLDRSYEVASSCIDTNIKGTLNILEALKGLSVRRFIYCSTVEVYGNGRVPFVETQKIDVVSPYSITKLTGEMFTQLYSKLHGIPVVILRLSNVYGPYQKKERFIPMAILSSLKGENIRLNSSKSKSRDFCFVGDVADAIFRAFDNKKAKDEIINIGNNKSTKLFDIGQLIAKEAGSKSKVICRENKARPLEKERWYCDFRKAKKILGWQPKTSLSEGIIRTIEWYRNFPKNQPFEG